MALFEKMSLAPPAVEVAEVKGIDVTADNKRSGDGIAEFYLKREVRGWILGWWSI